MNSSVPSLVVAVVVLVSPATVGRAQVIAQPTPAPIVTADSESWYLNGEPVTYSGNFYYPSGAQVPFNSNEMVRSGFHRGVPLYIRTTDEPFSVVYVPLARGFMQPYARLRTGDVAGTAGTTAPVGPMAAFSPAGATTVTPAQAAGPPTLVAGPPADELGRPLGTIGAVAREEGQRPTATSGAVPAAEPLSREDRRAMSRPTHTQIGPRPQGVNAVFVEFRDRRWFGEGQPVPLDYARMIEVGDLRGFPVFVDRDAPEARIYVATARGGSMVAPYSQRRTR